MATTPTLPLFDEPATPSQKPSPDGSSTSSGKTWTTPWIEELPEPEAKEILRQYADPIADLNRGWWETLNESTAQELLARYKREAQQAQSLAADLDPFEDENDGW